MKIHVLSDLHTEGKKFDMPEVDADVLVLAGDITQFKRYALGPTVKWAQDRPVIWVPGNHEYYHGLFPDSLNRAKMLAEGIPNLHILNNEELIIDDVRFLGTTLWTDFRLYVTNNNPSAKRKAMHDAEWGMSDYATISVLKDADTYDGIKVDKLMPEDIVKANEQASEWLWEMLWDHPHDKNVVITHHAPSPESILPEFDKWVETNPAFASDYRFMFPLVNTWIHGHMHTAMKYESNGCRVICNPRGYSRETESNGFDPELVIEV